MLDSTLQGALEYRVACCVLESGSAEWWVICPVTGQAIGPFLHVLDAERVRDLLNEAQLPAALRHASRYEP